MADQYGLFWNAVNNDRGYTADSFAEWLNHFFTTGVFSGELQVTAVSGMDIKVGSGYVNLKGKVRFFDSASTYTLATAGATYPRIDTVVVERNDTDRKISIKVVTGTYNGSSPSPTAPVRSAAIYQIVLAQIYVAAGATKITQENITDTRSNNSVCGIVTGTVKEMDYNQFAAQFNSYYSNFKTSNKADFDAWFNEIKGQLTSDAAGKLQTEINSLSAVATTSANGLMSAEDKRIIDNELLRMMPTGWVNITAGADINSKEYLKVGCYYCSDISIAENIENIPYKTAFMMYVLSPINKNYDNEDIDSWVYRLRIFVSYTGTMISIQSVNSGSSAGVFSYGPWIKFTNTTDLYDAIKALNSSTKSFTLSAASWVLYYDWYRYVIEDTLVTSTSNQEVVPSNSITREQLKALQKANLVGTQENGKMYLWVYGAVPTIDIPIQVIFRGTI